MHNGRAAFVRQTDQRDESADFYPSCAESADFSTPLNLDLWIIKESFALIEPVAERFVKGLYGRLFANNPKLRGMFPAALDGHGARLFRAITRIVWSLDSEQALESYLAKLGRGHRKFGVVPGHYPAVCDAFIATMRAFLGDAWTAEVQGAWQAAFDQISKIMIGAADDDARDAPPWWLGEVLAHEQRRPDLAVLTVRPNQPLPYRAGQYVSVQCTHWPRVWRTFSVANAPREDGILRFHVRAIPGGWVSRSLVHYTGPGDTLLLGPAAGAMVADAGSARDVLCVAGGTGLAPIKAIVQQLLADDWPGQRRNSTGRNIRLFFGARNKIDLYDLPSLRMMASGHPSLRVIPVVSDAGMPGAGMPGAGMPGAAQFDCLRGLLPDVVGRYSAWPDHDVYVSGPARMVRETIQILTAIGIPVTRIYSDPVETDP